MRNALIFCWCMLAVILDGFACAHADDIQIRETTQATSRGPLVVKAFLAPGMERTRPLLCCTAVKAWRSNRGFYERQATQMAQAVLTPMFLIIIMNEDIRVLQNGWRHAAQIFTQNRRLVADGQRCHNRGAGAGAGPGQWALRFSQGDFWGISVASRDTRIAALVVYYGGIPAQRKAGSKHPITHMPPLLELYGNADTVVPMEKGKELVELTRSLGQSAEMVVYPAQAQSNRRCITDAGVEDAEFFRRGDGRCEGGS